MTELRQALIEQPPSLPLLRAAASEIARLDAMLEQRRSGVAGTHGPGCWKLGPAHYECALRHIGELDR